MKSRHLFYMSIISMLFLFVFISCKNISRYSIDKSPLIKIDTSFLGIWKAVEDTNRMDYILVQNFDDVYSRVESKYKNDTYAFKASKTKEFDYYITRMNHSGINPFYQQWSAFLSNVGKERILNITYHDDKNEGYIFIRLIKMNGKKDTLTTTVIADTTLKYLKNSQQVKERVMKNIYKPSFYSDTLHFYKVSNYHLSINESIRKAN